MRGTLKVDCLIPGDQVSFYTVSGELVVQMVATDLRIEWDGRNQEGAKVSSGLYYYVVQRKDKVTARGKVLIVNGG